MLFFLKIINTYGWKGFKEFLKLKLGKISYLRFKTYDFETIYLSGYNRPILLRSFTTDYSTFKQIFHKKEYDIELGFEPKVIIDAGANIGLASIYFSNNYPNAKVLAIEPETSNYKKLLETVDGYNNILPIKAALHHTANEELEIIDQGVGHWGFATKTIDHNKIDTVDIVNTVCISDFFIKYKFRQIDILKIDIEGAEIEVFRKNFENWLPKVRCIIIEFHERFKPGSEPKIKSLLTNSGFSSYQKGENWIFTNNNISTK